jgi:DNA/RNA-binding domain of Phe-tRNA-synthetase-like protein
VPSVSIGPELGERCPSLSIGLIECSVTNRDHDAGLWSLIEAEAAAVAARVPLDRINHHPEILATREAYKRCGKDPNRYRPSAEALRRRVVQGKDLFRVNVVVDLVNLVSLRSGCSINAFDVDRIVGAVTWGIGRADETYAGIGCGPLNIAGLPVARDEQGPIGTPTRDEERTRLTAGTSRLLLNINAYAGVNLLGEVLDDARQLLESYAHAQAIRIDTVRPAPRAQENQAGH